MTETELLQAFYEDIGATNSLRKMHPPEDATRKTHLEVILPQEYSKLFIQRLSEMYSRNAVENWIRSDMSISFSDTIQPMVRDHAPEGKDFWRAVQMWGMIGHEELPPIP
jgi:hypothetical protein